MPRSKSLSHYPSRYAEILRECALDNKQIRIPCVDSTQAVKFKGHWYSFVGAVKTAERQVHLAITRQPLPTLSDHQQGILDLAMWQQRVMLTIEGDPPVVILQNRDHSWQARLVATAEVREGKPLAVTKAVDDIAARLMQVKGEQ